jgi:hypothetical protein
MEPILQLRALTPISDKLFYNIPVLGGARFKPLAIMKNEAWMLMSRCVFVCNVQLSSTVVGNIDVLRITYQV